jgi:hypothetical protein
VNLIFHILKKDIRRMRVFLGFWLFTLLLSAMVNGANVLIPAGDFSLQYAVEIILTLIGIFRVVLVAIAVPLLMHSEPLVGTTAFWQTRPVCRQDVLKSKLAFAGIFFILLPLLVDVFLLSASQFPSAYVLATIPEIVLSSVSLFLLLMAVAVLTRNFGYYALVLVSYYILAAVLVAGVQIPRLFSRGWSNLPPVSLGLADSRALLCSLVGIAFGAGIIALQFRTRKTFKSYVLLALLVAASFWAGQLSPWILFPEQKPEAMFDFGSEPVSILLSPAQESFVSDNFQSRKGAPIEKNIRKVLLFDGLPEGCYADIERISGVYSIGGTNVVASDILKQSYRSLASKPQVSAMEEMIAPLNLVKDRYLFSSAADLLRIPEADYLKYRGISGKYSSEITFNLVQFVPVTSLPLTVGSRHRDGASAFTLESLLKSTEGCTVILREERIRSIFKRDRTPVRDERYVYVLANRRTGEAFLQNRQPSSSSRFDFSKGRNFSIKRQSLYFTSAEKSMFAQPITDEWIADAELVILKRIWLGETVRPLKVDDFVFGRSTVTPFSSNEKESAKANDKLSTLTLPADATREAVQEYILKIHELSSGQRHWSSRDPQVGMLAAVGPENLSLLIELSRQGRFYTPYAVKAIARPEHKELILKNLAVMPELVDVVVKYGWTEDARGTLLAELKYRDNLPFAWIRAVAGFEDPETYPDLLAYFVNSSSPGSVYGIIKNLNGINLAKAVPDAWKNAKYSDSEYSYRCWQMIPIAMEYGMPDTLDAAAALLLEKRKESDYYKDKTRAAIRQHVGKFDTDEAFIEWLGVNRSDIRFAAEIKMFIGRRSLAPQVSPKEQSSSALFGNISSGGVN